MVDTLMLGNSNVHGSSAAVARIAANEGLPHRIKLDRHNANEQMIYGRSLLNGLTGYQISELPDIAIHQHRDDRLAAQLHDGTIHYYGLENVTTELTCHELFHQAQHEFRERRDMTNDSDMSYLLRAGPEGVLGEYGANKRSIIWNAMNEAGAYLFGFYAAYASEHGKEQDGSKVADALFQKFKADYGIDMNDAYERLMATVLSAGLDTAETIPSITRSGMAVSSRGALAALFAGLIYEMDNFDLGRALADLLDDPDKSIARVLSLGAEGAKEHFEHFQLYLMGVPELMRNE